MIYWLTSIPPLADLALFILRFVIGAMFAMSGYFKLTDSTRRKKMEDSLKQGGMPTNLAPLVAVVELLGGLGVLFGLLTALAAFGLLAVSLVALITVIVPTTEGSGIHKLENLLYSPEVLICAGLIVLMATGAGGWSLDRLLLS